VEWCSPGETAISCLRSRWTSWKICGPAMPMRNKGPIRPIEGWQHGDFSNLPDV
jgi:hypothetical protein